MQRALSIISICFSLVALIVSGLVAWHTTIGPAKLVGALPYIIVWSFYDHPESKVSDRRIVPNLWIRNIGARPIMIQDLRLIYHLNQEEQIISYPTNSIPVDAIESPSTFHDYGQLSMGHAPFVGFSLASMEKWQSNYSYHIGEEHYKKITGPIRISIQIKAQAEPRWIKVFEETIYFNRFILKGPFVIKRGTAGPEYFYSELWKERKRKEP